MAIDTGIQSPRKPKLLDQVRDRIRAKHYSIRTEEAYVQWIRRYILFHDKRHPREMGGVEINEFLSRLAVDKNMSASTQNQALCAILFLYKEVLQQEISLPENLIRAKKPQKLPVVLTKEEVKSILGCMSGIPWIMAYLLYGGGLRLMECVRLRVKDIDFSYNQITVREGKGNKDRVTMLPDKIKEHLLKHLDGVKKRHDAELRNGFGGVYLPYALEVKYPHAHR